MDTNSHTFVLYMEVIQQAFLLLGSFISALLLVFVQLSTMCSPSSIQELFHITVALRHLHRLLTKSSIRGHFPLHSLSRCAFFFFRLLIVTTSGNTLANPSPHTHRRSELLQASIFINPPVSDMHPFLFH